MRTHTTKTLKALVLDKLDPQKYQMADHECEVWMQSLPEIEREMLEAMQFFNCILFDKGMRCRQYQQIHRECIYLLDKADKLGLLEGKMETLRQALVATLDVIIEKLLADYDKFIDFEHWMPVIHLRREQARISVGITELKARFDGLGVPVKLQEEVFFCIKEVLKGQRCLYTRMRYVRALMEGLPEVCRSSNKACICEDLLHYLVERNYNAERFVRYYMKFVTEEVAGRVPDAEKQEYLKDQEWRLRSRTYRKSVYRYDDTRKQVKQVLHDFICAELGVVRNRMQTNERIAQEASRVMQVPPVVKTSHQTNTAETVAAQVAASAAGLSSQMDRPVAYKIRTPMTVDMLAYFIKLMVKAKVIEPGVTNELMAFVAGIFQTPGTGLGGISAGSLGVKYRSVVQTTAVGVRALVARMLKEIDAEFNGQ